MCTQFLNYIQPPISFVYILLPPTDTNPSDSAFQFYKKEMTYSFV
jgi:hypothetical protein